MKVKQVGKESERKKLRFRRLEKAITHIRMSTESDEDITTIGLAFFLCCHDVVRETILQH